MPPKPGKVPSYCRHKASGQAVVRIDGADHYLGLYGSDISHERYARRIAEWRSHRQPDPSRPARVARRARLGAYITVEHVLALYWQFAKGYYQKDGVPSGELANMKYAMRPLRKLYANLPACDFGPIALKALQQHLTDSEQLCRLQINARINRIKRIFKWAVSEQLVPAGIYEGLKCVAGLRFGRTHARETKPIKPVLDDQVDATLPFVSREVAAMIRLQRLTGMRPNEVVQLRMSEIDDSGEIWIYEPLDHKNCWRGHRRQIPLGPQSQALLEPFIRPSPSEYLFSPAEAEQRRNALRRVRRATPMTPSQAKRTAKLNPQRAKRIRYDVQSYRRAISRGIVRALKQGVVICRWHPNQLRHSRATEIRRHYGVEAAQVSLGHARADVTQIYAERNMSLAIAIAKQSG